MTLSSIVPLDAIALRSADTLPIDFKSSTKILKEIVGLALVRFKNPKGRPVTLRILFKQRRKVVIDKFRKRYGESENIHNTLEILRQICTQRDSRVVLALRGIAIAWLTAFGEEYEKINKFIAFLFGTMFRRGETDTILSSYKKAVGIMSNRLTNNVVEGCSKVAKDPDQEKILEFIDDILKSKHDEGKFTDLDIFWYVSILSQTRILPLPNRESCVEKIVEYIEGLCKPYTVKDKTPMRQQWIPRNQFLNHDSSSQVWEKDLLQGCEEVGKLIGQDICINMQKEAERVNSTFKDIAERKKDYHCSLSSSSCIEHGRSEGGKWNSLTSGEFREFLETPVCDIFEFKNDSWVDSNGKLVCYNEDSTLEIWRIAYLDKPLEG